MKLWEIDNALMGLFDPDTGEITDSLAWDKLQMEREKKLEGVALWIKNLLSDADAIKAEKDALAKREAAARKKAEGLTKWLDRALQGEKLSTARCAVSYRKSEALEIQNEELFIMYADKERKNLLTYPMPVPNKKLIKELLKEGYQIPSVSLVERYNLQIK